MASEQHDPVVESLNRLADQIDVLVAAIQAASETIAGAVKQSSPPHMTAEGVTD